MKKWITPERRKHLLRRVDTEECEPKVGLVYRKFAKRLFEEKHPDLTAHEVDEILFRRSFREIESYVPVEENMIRIIGRIQEKLTDMGVHYPKDFLDVLKYSETPESDLEEVLIEIGMKKLRELILETVDEMPE